VAGRGLPHGGGPLTSRFLALGDSYTIGEGVAGCETWPYRLAAALRQLGYGVAEPKIIARTGWTTDELQQALEERDPGGPYELVTLLIGVNNQYRGQQAADYREHFRPLLERAIRYAGGDPRRTLVLSIPDWSVTPFAAGRGEKRIAEAIDRFNEANLQETAIAGTHYIDLTSSSRAAAGDASMLAADGLHPSAAMHAIWTELILPVASEILRPK
jgi:lysophospholipase L1-like esterase